MCGLVGYITKDGKPPAVSARQLKKALLRCAARGTDATGVFWEEDKDFKIFKAPIAAEYFTKYIPWDRVAQSPMCIMHTRAMTQGSVDVFTNNHPIIDGRRILAHNGMIANSDDFVKDTVVDSLAILEAVKLADNKSEPSDLSFEILIDALSLVAGTAAFSLFDIKSRKLFLLSSGNPLIIGYKENTIFWASTTKIIRSMRPYMMTDMLTDYLVCVDKEFMKGKPVDLAPLKRSTVGKYQSTHTYGHLGSYYSSNHDFNDHDDPRVESAIEHRVKHPDWYSYNTKTGKYDYIPPKKGVVRDGIIGKRETVDGKATVSF